MGFLEGLIKSVAAPIVGGIFGASGQSTANKTNIKLQRENQAWQENMSNTAWQRGTADMMAAGINPMLAVNQGGAGTPQTSPATVLNENSAAMSSAQQAVGTMQGIQQIEQSQGQTELFRAQARKAESETMEKELNAALAAADLATKKGIPAVQEADVKLKNMSSAKAVEEATLTAEQQRGARADSLRKELELGYTPLGFKEPDRKPGNAFDADVAKRKADARIRILEEAQVKAESDFYKGQGANNPYIKQILDIIKGVSSAASIGKR